MSATVPSTLSYQGRVQVQGTAFTGTGQFKVALVSQGTNSNRRATASATVSFGFIVNINVADGGSGYLTPPAVMITDSTGSGAAATAQVSGGQITGVTVQQTGSGYSPSPMVTIGLPQAGPIVGTYWSNDGSSSGGSEPVSAVSVGVIDGLFTLLLGGTNLPNMLPIPAAVFASRSDAHVRIWFNDGVHGFTRLSPDQPLTSVGYAMTAATVGDGTVTTASLADGSVTAAKLGGGVVSSNQIADGSIALSDLSAAALGTFWRTGGNTGTTPGVNFLGTADNQPIEVQVNGQRALRLEPNVTSPNVIGGFRGNFVTNGVFGAVIGGGGQAAAFTNKVLASFGTVSGGRQNTASGLAAIVAGGHGNAAGADYATVGGGRANIASNQHATVSGGRVNFARADYAAVGGGFANHASGPMSVVGGGENNQAAAQLASIGGGSSNIVTGAGAVIAGGATNFAGADFSAIGGGIENTASGYAATIGGGTENSAADYGATVSGGSDNDARGSGATIGGGFENTANSTGATIGGGEENSANGLYATVAGGEENSASAYVATVAGGYFNRASASFATIGGGDGNHAENECATVGGGRFNYSGRFGTVSGGVSNYASGLFASVGGGIGNTAYQDDETDFAMTIAGGHDNDAQSKGSTIGGGGSNAAFGLYATVPGGWDNRAGSYSFAAGRRAYATAIGSFVWADASIDAPLSTVVGNEFIARASGGVAFFTTPNLSVGVKVNPGANAWSPMSDRNVKENFKPVDVRDVLEKVSQVPITEWNLKTQDASIRHLGPMAQDFRAAFGLGEDERHISTTDADGVALAAIQGLHAVLKEKETEIQELKRSVAELKELLTRLSQQQRPGM